MKRSLPVLGGSKTAPALGGPLGVLAGQRLVVTGADGYLGRSFVEHARGQGADVVSDLSAGDWDAVVHLGSAETEALYRAAATAAGSARPRRFVHVSSTDVHGSPADLPVTEAHPFQPITEVGITSARDERRLRELAPELGLPLVVTRPSPVYGANDPGGTLDELARRIEGHRHLVVGRGDTVLHHLHVDDFVRGLTLVVISEAAAGEDFILCGPETITALELSRRVADLRGRWLPRVHVPLALARRAARVLERVVPARLEERLEQASRSLFFDGSKARRLLGFTPSVGYREGLGRSLTRTDATPGRR